MDGGILYKRNTATRSSVANLGYDVLLAHSCDSFMLALVGFLKPAAV